MKWQFTEDKPIYQQIVEQVQLKIAAGHLQPGERLSSVRDLAAEAGVNPNTMQRAMAELERLELVYTERTAGRMVTQDAERIQQERNLLARQQAEAFLEAMRHLGYGADEAVELLHSCKQQEGEQV